LYKTDLEEKLGTKERIAEARLPAYKKIWELTSFASTKETLESLTGKEREEIISLLKKWYFDDGQGIFLSENIHSQYSEALKMLEGIKVASHENDQIVKTFSSLRRSLKNEIGIYGKIGYYNYRLAEDYKINISIMQDSDISTDYIELTSNGRLTIKKGYAWDGPSGPTKDTKNFMRGSLVHDALYQLLRERHLSSDYRKYIDDLLYHILIEDGMSKVRAWWVYQGIQLGGDSSSRSEKSIGNKFGFLSKICG
jgi:hypothetical protein